MPRQMEPKETRDIRESLLKEQDYFCPLCESLIDPKDAALDHCHDTGRIRGVLHLRCNSIEGALKSKFKRGGGLRYTDFETYLKNLALYLTKEHHMLLHPSNRPGPKKLMKSSYNHLIREIKHANLYYKSKNKKLIKFPDYPKSKKLTKRLAELFEEFALSPVYYNE